MHLVHAGYQVSVYARRPEAADPLAAAGASRAGTITELASRSDVVITMVTATSDVEEVVTGEGGVLSSARPGTVVIDMSTIAPDGTRRIAAALRERQVDMLDAPVTGGPAGAQAATLTIMVGGDAAVLERMRPMLERLGTQIVHMGGNGAGQIAKACNQLALLVTAEGVAEALSLGTACGLDPRVLRQAMLGGIAASRVLDLFGARMAERNFEPGLESRLYDKDLNIVLDLARGVGRTVPGAHVVRRHLDEVMARGEGRKDLSALIKAVERSTGSAE
jgi:2-hydroxy-3-oxopropionate reductase